MPFLDYSYDRGDDFHYSGGFLLSHKTRDLAGELFQIEATLGFGRDGDGLLYVDELLEITASGAVHRLSYSYHFEYRGQFHFRYERDPENHPEMPEHKHVPPDETRIESDPVRLQDVFEELSTIVSEIEEADLSE